MANSELFDWDKEELTPVELLDRYKHKFPRIVLVKEGFCGTHAWECISQAEILLIHCSTSQKRVIARDPQGRYYSFPVGYNANFYPIKLKKRLSKGAKPLSALLAQYPLPFDVEVETEESCMLTTGAEEQSRMLKLQTLTITDTYEERFMKANLIRPEGLNRHVIKIAAYVNVKLAVSKSEEVLRQVITAAEKIDLDAVEANQQILMYSKAMVENKTATGVYETLPPSKTLATSAVYETLSKASAAGVVAYGQRETLFDPVIAQWRLDELENQGRKKPVQSVTPTVPEQAANLNEDKWENISRDTKTLTCDEIADCLRMLNLQKYCKSFKEHQIDGDLLLTLDLEDFRTDMGMSRIEAKKLIKFREGWRPNETLPRSMKGKHSSTDV